MNDKLSGGGDLDQTDLDISELTEKVHTLEKNLRTLLDRQNVVDIYRRYTRGLNRFDLESLSTSFWEDAKITYGFNTYVRDEWIGFWTSNRYLKGLACQAHHIANETIDIVDDIAHVESYLIGFWSPPTDAQPGLIVGGRYIDRVDRRGDEWRIAMREFIPHFWSETKSIFKTWFDGHAWPESGFGSGDKSDPCYRRPLKPR